MYYIPFLSLTQAVSHEGAHTDTGRQAIRRMHPHAHMHMRAHTHTRARTYARTHKHTHTHTQACTHTHTRTHTHTHTHAHTHIHTHIYRHKHTHTHTRSLSLCLSLTHTLNFKNPNLHARFFIPVWVSWWFLDYACPEFLAPDTKDHWELTSSWNKKTKCLNDPCHYKTFFAVIFLT